MVINTHKLLKDYVKDRVVQSSDHQRYEHHKEMIDLLCGGNSYLYERWIKKVVHKMGI